MFGLSRVSVTEYEYFEISEAAGHPFTSDNP